MTQTLAIGNYTPDETQKLESEFAPLFLDDPTQIGTLDAALRDQIKAVAYKGHHPFGPDAMAQLPALGIIANYGVGYDAIDVAVATHNGIKITNTPDVLNDDVADLAVGMILMHGRQMAQASSWMRSGHWAGKGAFALNRKVSGSTAGILGLGRIGREIAVRLEAFKMDIHYWSRSEKDTLGYIYHDDPVALAGAVDYLVVALVGGAETQRMVSADVLSALGENGVLVNISRGSTVDEAALFTALETGTINGAALDVFDNEPQIDPRFYALDNVVLQPHQGSGTVETRAAMAALQRDNISAFLNGAPLVTPVN
ncbi:2-hydroxyacid dehydrogenase [Yoonia sp. BS5-3]|uniref:2-hydroxyacid dehydrogenase n=1 Tax=Yoonia phaeophyticola TaxID=3137369 RepID=A0ABZ2V8V6_9RHOB